VPNVTVTRAVAQQTQGELRHQVDAATVHDAIACVIEQHPLLRRYILTDNGVLRQHVNVFLNDALVADRRGLTDSVEPSDEIHVLQAVSGGQQFSRDQRTARSQ
jgi:sulfur carrier protein ThiS